MAENQETWITQNAEAFKDMLQRKQKHVRSKRFTINPPIKAIVRPFGMRHYGFWMLVHNFSASGFLFGSSSTNQYVPFREGTIIQATIDLNFTIFERPIHVKAEVVRVGVNEKGETEQVAVKILDIEDRHRQVFWDGFKPFGLPSDTEE